MDDQSIGESSPGSTPQFSASPRARILVVDDNDDIRELIRTALSDEGYGVMAFSHGETALRLIEERMPDLILLDSFMPIMGDKEFLEAYRRMPGPHAPVIVVTAGRESAKAGGLSVAGHLFKPFDLEELLEIVGQHTQQPSA